jgi:hypothetical protein
MLDEKNNNQLCNQYYNAYSHLTLSPDKNMLYYLATDNRVWYYFNDKENSDALFPGQTVRDVISKENWNKTSLNYNKGALGPMAIDPVSGELYYVGYQWYHPKLNRVTWVNADNPVACSITDQTYDDYNSFRKGIIDTIITDKQKNIILIVYPNPSNYSFIFEMTNFSDKKETFGLTVTDITGKQVFKTNSQLTSGNNKIIWDNLNNNNAGIYFYKIQISDTLYSGKLLKL